MIDRFFAFLLLFVSLPAAAHAQQVVLAPLPVERSPLIEKLVELKRSGRTASADELAAAADEVLQKFGIDFAFSLDAATCTRLNELRLKQKDPNAPLGLGGTLQSIGGDRAKLALPDPVFLTSECGGCLISLPVLQVATRDLIVIVRERNIKFAMPANFVAEMVHLVDDSPIIGVRNSWRIPFRTEPVGISSDAAVIYLAFSEPELFQLSLLVYDEGSFRIGTMAEAEAGGKGSSYSPKDPGAASLGHRFTRFERWGRTFVLGWKPPCPAQTRK